MPWTGSCLTPYLPRALTVKWASGICMPSKFPLVCHWDSENNPVLLNYWLNPGHLQTPAEAQGLQKSRKPTVQNKERRREKEREGIQRDWEEGPVIAPQHPPRWVFVCITRFLVLSLRNGLMSVYRAWMYQGWLTKWTPPKRAGKLSWGGKREMHTN